MLGDDVVSAVNKAMKERYENHEPPEMIDLESLMSGQTENLKAIADHTAELQTIAEAAIAQAKLAEEQAKSAKQDALFSKVLSILSLLISLASLVVAIVSLTIG